MKFLICAATSDQLQDDVTGLFLGTNGKLYNYAVTFDEDDGMVAIRDSIGRILPLDVTEIAGFANIFSHLNAYQRDMRNIDSKLTDALQDASADAVFAYNKLIGAAEPTV